jgi:gluconate 2-dehydrogenase gamma chain
MQAETEGKLRMAEDPDDKTLKGHSRREVLKLVGAASVIGESGFAAAQGVTAPAPVREALETLTAAEADILEAFCGRLIPSDANGPGAWEARAAHYIDRALGGALASAREIYRSGLMALDAYARESKDASFSALDAKSQDAVLTDIEKSDPEFFNLVRQHTLQGTFCDPYYGGNAGFVGWDLIAYPGIRMSVSEQDEAMKAHPAHMRKSAYDFPMFDRHSAGIADRISAPMDQAHMPYGMGNTKVGN